MDYVGLEMTADSEMRNPYAYNPYNGPSSLPKYEISGWGAYMLILEQKTINFPYVSFFNFNLHGVITILKLLGTQSLIFLKALP